MKTTVTHITNTLKNVLPEETVNQLTKLRNELADKEQIKEPVSMGKEDPTTTNK